MKRQYVRTLLAVGALALTSASVRADVVPPPANPANQPVKKEAIVAPPRTILRSNLTVVAKPDYEWAARLQIPQSKVKQLQEALAGLPTTTKPEAASGTVQSSMPTVMAGLLMFLALSWGGVLLARSMARRERKPVTVAMVALALLGAAGMAAYANMAPPPSGIIRWAGLPTAIDEGRPTTGTVEIQIVPEGNEIALIIPRRAKPVEPKPAQ